jgi:hypothetical protein
MRDTIRACQFCKAQGKGYYLEMMHVTHDGLNFVIVYCKFCGASGPFGTNPQNAEEKWNRRVI